MSSKYHNFSSKPYKYDRNETLKYIADHNLRLSHVQQKLLEVTQGHASGRMMGDAVEHQFFQNLLQAIKGKKVLEVGVFTGYGTLSFALALPDGGTVVAMDISEEYATIGKPFWKEAGISDKIDLRIGPAAEIMQKMIDNGESGTYDFAFIDADKENYDIYYEQCLKLVRSGGIIAVDNTLWGGQVLDPADQDSSTVALRNIAKKIHGDDRVNVSMLWLGDGTTLAFKK